MNAIVTAKGDTGAVPARDAVPGREPDLALGMVHHFLRHILQSVEADAAPWRKQITVVARGADFDLRQGDDAAAVLDTLAMTGDAMGEALARGDSPSDVGHSVMPHLEATTTAFGDRRKTANEARYQNFAKSYRAAVTRLEEQLSSVVRGMNGLSRVAARGAAGLDPDAAGRIVSRMRNLGDATMRLIEDKIASSATRDDGKRLRALRDEFKLWIEERNARLEQMQNVVDELNIRSNALRNVCLMQAKRLKAAAALAAQASGAGRIEASARTEQASPEAMVLSGGLRALLLEARADIIGPLRV